MPSKWIAVAGAVPAGLGVALGAFGAHGLDKFLQEHELAANLAQRLQWYDTAVRYQLFHALGLLAIAALAGRAPGRLWNAAATLLVLGIALFSGSLYAMTFLTSVSRPVVLATPAGGLALIIGWAFTAIASWRQA